MTITSHCGSELPHTPHQYSSPGPFSCPGTSMSDLVAVPVSGEVERVQWGSVQTVVYRDTLQGVRFTGHVGDKPIAGGWAVYSACWIVQHDGHRADRDGAAVFRSEVFHSSEEFNRAWNELRASLSE